MQADIILLKIDATDLGLNKEILIHMFEVHYKYVVCPCCWALRKHFLPIT